VGLTSNMFKIVAIKLDCILTTLRPWIQWFAFRSLSDFNSFAFSSLKTCWGLIWMLLGTSLSCFFTTYGMLYKIHTISPHGFFCTNTKRPTPALLVTVPQWRTWLFWVIHSLIHLFYGGSSSRFPVLVQAPSQKVLDLIKGLSFILILSRLLRLHPSPSSTSTLILWSSHLIPPLLI
jgi:hypothetical protein